MVISHLVGVYWGMPNVIAEATFAEVQNIPTPSFTSFADNDYVHLGPLGVAIFFLISGFVIPLTIVKVKARAFLVSRGFRIYPTYIACSLISLCIVFMSAHYWGNDFSKSALDIGLNFFLIHNYFGVPSIDLVNWTLAVEIKFYLLIAILASSIRRKKTAPLFGLLIAISVLNFYVQDISPWLNKEGAADIFKQLMIEFTYISYMLIGVLFYYHYTGAFTTKKLLCYLAIAFGLFSMTWLKGAVNGAYAIVLLDYCYALLIFSGAYGLREKFREIVVFDWVGDISYPLYIIHSLVGYSLLNILIDLQIAYILALAITLFSIGVMAYVIHLYIEGPSNRFGKKLGGAL